MWKKKRKNEGDLNDMAKLQQIKKVEYILTDERELDKKEQTIFMKKSHLLI